MADEARINKLRVMVEGKDEPAGLFDVAIELASNHGLDQPAPDWAWDAYVAGCLRHGSPAADTHQGAAIHAFVLGLLDAGHGGLDVTIGHLVRTGRLPARLG